MAMFGIGPVELLIIGVVLLILLGAVVVPVVLIVLLQRKKQSPPNPNLSPCPDCGWLISRQAISCPQCGRPIKPPVAET